jgi:peptide/nickel transport system substrate-binding protein
VYVRNPDYIPRDETPSGSTGGKKVYLDKVIWRYIPDPWDAAEDLAAGEADWWEQPPLDFIPKIEQNPDLQTLLLDPLGTHSISAMRLARTQRNTIVHSPIVMSNAGKRPTV